MSFDWDGGIWTDSAKTFPEILACPYNLTLNAGQQPPGTVSMTPVSQEIWNQTVACCGSVEIFQIDEECAIVCYPNGHTLNTLNSCAQGLYSGPTCVDDASNGDYCNKTYVAPTSSTTATTATATATASPTATAKGGAGKVKAGLGVVVLMVLASLW